MKACNKCGVGTEFYPSVSQPCKECVKLQNLRYYHAVDTSCGLTNGKRNYWVRRVNRQKSMQRYRERVWHETVAHYSNGSMVCECCGEPERKFLGMDHIEPIGRPIPGTNKAIDGSPRGSIGLMAWLRKRGYPEGFRILCHNCNLGRHINGGICPHEEVRRAKVA